MSKRAKITLVVAIVILLIPIVTILLALQNPPWANSPFFVNIETRVSAFILTHFDLITIPEDQDISPVAHLVTDKRKALIDGKIKTLSAREISGKNFKEPLRSRNVFVIATIDPVDVEGKPVVEKRRIIKAVDDLAVKGKVDAIVEATASDTARANAWGFKEAQRLHSADIIRCVIFDGGHHIGTLPLRPDIVLLPAIKYKGILYASHWYTRDSVPIWKLQKAIRKEHMSIVAALFPRNGIPVKNPSGMALIANQAILKVVKKAPKATGNRPEQNQGITTAIPPGTRFIWLEADPSSTQEDVLRKVQDEIKGPQKGDQKVERVYIGITYGTSNFPHISKKVKFSGGELETFLNKELPFKVMVMSEPFSTWDIFSIRLGLLR